jgi:threonine dehydrogenase-like Zn-dependent dehydrogenase
VPERCDLAEEAGALTISSDGDVHELLKEMTGGRGPDACIDAVGMEAHGSTYDLVKQTVRLETDRPHVLRQAMRICRKGGTLSIPGMYRGFIDKIPFGVAFAKGLTIRMGQTHVHKYMKPLLGRIERNEIDPTCVISHRAPLANAAAAYQTFADKADGCIKVVLKPQGLPAPEKTAEAGARRVEPREDWAKPRSKRLRPV